MSDVILRVVACLTTTGVFCISTAKLVGAMQQSRYDDKTFLRWLKRKDNLYFNRLTLLTLCLLLASSVSSLCFSFLGKREALLVSALPFFGLSLLFGILDDKYAFKIPAERTGRWKRLFAAYTFVTACVSYILIAVLQCLSKLNGSTLYALIAFAPYAVMPILLPWLLCLANALMCVFENAHNKKFVKRAGQVLDESKILRVAVVGSYGKTSVKNILQTVLSEKYAVVETPYSYNTPVGVAKTVFSETWQGKEVFLAEMGARKSGDVAELCRLVKPDYAVFTGVCEQHIETFGSVENVFAEKRRVVEYTRNTVVCGEALKPWFGEEKDGVAFTDEVQVKNVQFSATETACVLLLDGQEIRVQTKLLGKAALENMRAAALLAHKMGLTPKEIERGLSKVKPVPHRLQLLQNEGVYILDDGYNANPLGAKEALDALSRFEGGKWVVTPGIIECGILEQSVNHRLGEQIAQSGVTRVLLVGETLVNAVKAGYESVGGDMSRLTVVPTLSAAQEIIGNEVTTGDCVLFLNDLPDVY